MSLANLPYINNHSMTQHLCGNQTWLLRRQKPWDKFMCSIRVICIFSAGMWWNSAIYRTCARSPWLRSQTGVDFWAIFLRSVHLTQLILRRLELYIGLIRKDFQLLNVILLKIKYIYCMEKNLAWVLQKQAIKACGAGKVLRMHRLL